ncbi:MAG TPA: hypothetical protein GX696_11135 [Pseudomonadaceae bacterium]|nr:hypothetical protein [Pseudomonadaceae bacterium]
MKCFYYLSPSLVETGRIADDLRKSGVNHWFIHVISENEAGLSRHQLHSSNYLETMDLLRNGLIGASLGFLLALLFVTGISFFELFGGTLPPLAWLGIIVLLTSFGAWQGGLIGISSENRKIQPFRPAIKAGEHLLLVYANRKEEEKIHAMMTRLHPEAKLAALDAQFYNPFSEPTLV